MDCTNSAAPRTPRQRRWCWDWGQKPLLVLGLPLLPLQFPLQNQLLSPQQFPFQNQSLPEPVRKAQHARTYLVRAGHFRRSAGATQRHACYAAHWALEYDS
jgi:hypothetical protein